MAKKKLSALELNLKKMATAAMATFATKTEVNGCITIAPTSTATALWADNNEEENE